MIIDGMEFTLGSKCEKVTISGRDQICLHYMYVRSYLVELCMCMQNHIYVPTLSYN